MIASELENQASNGIRERLSYFTVVVDVSLQEKPNWGTGSLIKFNNRFFILTCAHVVTKDYPNSQIGVLFHTGGTQITGSKEIIKNTPLPELLELIPNRSFRQEVDIINRYYSNAKDDLVFLELNPSSVHVKNNEFYDLMNNGIKSPELNQGIYLAGFSEELARDLGKKRVGVSPFYDMTLLASQEIEVTDFNPDREFLIVYTFDEKAVEPRGLSGCGVWVRLPSGNDNIWTPNIYFAGVQKAVYRKNQVLAVTKAEAVLQLISAQIVPI